MSKQRRFADHRASSERRAWLVKWWGDGESVTCVYCNKQLFDRSESGRSSPLDDQITTDKIIPHQRSYERANCVPACSRCNNDRGDQDFWVYARSCDANPDYMVARAAELTRLWEAEQRGFGNQLPPRRVDVAKSRSKMLV